MNHVVKIVTHHTDNTGAAKAWAKDGVCAIGFVFDSRIALADSETIKQHLKDIGRNESSIPSYVSQFLRFRDDIEVGDIVFAYVGGNIVGLVGEIETDFIYSGENDVAQYFNYPNQRSVRWWKEPRFFDRRELPHDLVKWVATTGTILRKEYDTVQLKEILGRIKSGDAIDSLETQNEDEIKDFIEDNISKIEDGLIFEEREKEIAGRFMDFFTTDADGNQVIIEVKQWGTPDGLTQLRGYMRDLRRESEESNIRGILVALDFSRECIEDCEELVSLGVPIKLCRAKKTFTFSNVS